jgi:hypothetical protein
VSVTSELFGPKSVGVNHNILITNIPLGSFLYGQIAAMVYDANGQRMSVMDNRTGTIDTMIMCMGVKCYSTTFFVWGCITLLGLASSIVLFKRTKPAYAATASRSSCKHQVSSWTEKLLDQCLAALKSLLACTKLWFSFSWNCYI